MSIAHEVVQDIDHLARIIEQRQLKVAFLGELGGYEIAVSADSIIRLYHETVPREHHLIAKMVGNQVVFSIGVPMTAENLARMGIGVPHMH